ncbi:MAG: hypothetical protein D6814_10780 [Calditrichaeota bacterium]|nr:MAG: hypothetical protein D6814_10780 [Calditrichota bacterium]
MQKQIKRVLFPLSLLIMASFALSCSSTSRYKPDKFGKPQAGDMDQALQNIDRAMKNMSATKKRAMAKQQAAIRAGKELFNDPNLGSNGLSCNSCHPGGGTTGGEAEIAKKMGHGPYKLPIPSLIGAAARFPKYKVPNDAVITLAQMDNNCIRMFMKGKRLPLNSPESFYLAAYVSSLSDGEEVQVGGSMK